MLKKQKGSAIILALIVVAVVALIALRMMGRFEKNIHQETVIISLQKADLQSQLLLLQQEDQLIKDSNHQNTTQPTDPNPFPTTHSNDGTVSGTIIDLQSRYNLNNLSSFGDNSITSFAILLRAIEPTLSEETARDLAKNVQRWVQHKNSKEDLIYYASQNPPYAPGNGWMSSVSELRLVKGMSPELYEILQPYVTALPGENIPININTASKPILLSLGFSEQTAETLIQNRPYTDAHPLSIAGLNLLGPYTSTSNYFLSHVSIHIPGQNLLSYKRALHRLTQNGQTKIIILWSST